MEYCRLCMEEENLLDMDDSIRDCIENVFSIEINDGLLSRDICQSCKGFVSQVIEFKEKVSKVQKLLRKILRRKVTRVEPVDDIVVEDLTVKESRHRKTPRKTDQICASQDLTDSNVTSESGIALFSKSMTSVNPDEVKEIAEKMRPMWNSEIKICPICQIEIADEEKFNKHVGTYKHMFKSYVVEKSGKADIFSTHMVGYACTICAKTFTNNRNLAVHNNEKHGISTPKNTFKPNTVVLRNCKLNENDASILPGDEDELDVNVGKNKMTESPLKHKIPAKKETSIMPENTGRIKIKNELANTINVSNQHPCKVCKKLFEFAESLARHCEIHHKGVFICSYCDFTSISKRNFCDHLRKHYNLTYHQKICSICFTVCNSNIELLRHRKNVHTPSETEERPKKKLCRRCNREFISLEFDKHSCVALKYPCLKKCGRRFETFSMMERHTLKCNSGLTIYICKRCNKSMKTLKSLETHTTKCLLKRSPQPSTESKISCVEKLAKKIETPLSTAENSAGTTPEKTKLPAASISSNNSKGQKLTLACKKCNMGFTELKHLTQHSLIAHSKPNKISSKANGQLITN